jgi:hypothetical protein
MMPTSNGSTERPPPSPPLGVYPLPGFLSLTEPLELQDLPLQVALLTMEVAQLRRQLILFAQAAAMLTPPEMVDVQWPSPPPSS